MFTRYSLLISNYLGSCHRIVYNNVMKMKSICKAVISVYVKVYVPFTFFPFPFICNSSTFGHVNLFKTNSNIIFMERSLFKFALLGVMLLISHSSFHK